MDARQPVVGLSKEEEEFLVNAFDVLDRSKLNGDTGDDAKTNFTLPRNEIYFSVQTWQTI